MTELVKKFSLQERALHELAKVFWGDFVQRFPFNYYKDELVSRETKNLMAHREAVVRRISKFFPSTLPKMLRDNLIRAVIFIQRGYSEAIIWSEIYSYSYSRIDLLTPTPLMSGPYSAKNFIDPAGYFNELIWAKCFVSDESISVYCRFELACFYCLEETIRDLWISIKNNGRYPYEGRFFEISKNYNYLVGFWIHHLENEFEKIVCKEGIHVRAFRNSIKSACVYSARFFWARCTDEEKSIILSEMDDDDFNHLSNLAGSSYAECVNFVYSLLPTLDKKFFILWITENDQPFIWTCLLCSRFYESVLNDILTPPFPISSRTYALILNSLALKMKELPIPVYNKIFEAIWKPLSQKQQREILENELKLIPNSAKIKSMELLETIIQPFSCSEKDRMLLYDWQFAGMSVMDIFSEVGDYDAVHRYLLLFLMDRDPKTEKITVRKNAVSFLDRFLYGDIFILWTKRQIPESEQKRFNNVVKNLQASLHVLYCLLDQVERLN